MLGIIYFILAFVCYLDERFRYLSVFFLIALLTSNFQMATLSAMSFPGSAVSKSYDWVMLFCGVLFFVVPSLFFNAKVVKYFKFVFLFLGALIIISIYSVFVLHAEASIVLRAARQFIFFIIIFVSVPLSIEEHKKILRLVVYCTTAASFFYCFQPFIGTDLLNNVIAPKLEIHLDETFITRYYNIPVYIIPTLILLFSKKALDIKFQLLLITINIAALLIYQTRSLLLTLGICFAVHYFMSYKVNVIKLAGYAIVGVLLFFAVDAISGNRFSNGMQDISGGKFTVSDVKYMTPNDIPNLSTSEFRFFHLAERVEYVLGDTKRAIMGIGLITEDSRLTGKLNFSVGLLGDDNQPNQISTGDVAWSVLILNFGLFGIAAYLLLYFNLMQVFISLRFDGVMKAGICYIIALFITSFYQTAMILPFITGFIMLFASYAFRLKQDLNRKEYVA